MTHWKLEWLTIGEEQEHRDDSVVMAGIGPDGARIMRGSTIMWPYLKDGSFCPLYQKQAEILISPLAKHTLSRFFIRQMCQEVVERIFGNGQPSIENTPQTVSREELERGAPISYRGLRFWVNDAGNINCRSSINPEAKPDDPVEHGG